MDKVDLNKYEEFVSSVTSEESNSKVAMSTRMEAIESKACKYSIVNDRCNWYGK